MIGLARFMALSTWARLSSSVRYGSYFFALFLFDGLIICDLSSRSGCGRFNWFALSRGIPTRFTLRL